MAGLMLVGQGGFSVKRGGYTSYISGLRILVHGLFHPDESGQLQTVLFETVAKNPCRKATDF